MKSSYTGLKRILYAALYSWKGIKSSWKHEAAFRQEVLLLIILTPVAVLLGETALEIIILIGVLLMLITVELLNSAVESVVDRTGEDYHKLAGRAKDQGSAAVLFAFIIVLLVWGAVLYTNVLSQP